MWIQRETPVHHHTFCLGCRSIGFRSFHGSVWDVPTSPAHNWAFNCEIQKTRILSSKKTRQSYLSLWESFTFWHFVEGFKETSRYNHVSWNFCCSETFPSVLSHKTQTYPNQQQEYYSHFLNITQWGSGRYEFISLFRVMRFKSIPAPPPSSNRIFYWLLHKKYINNIEKGTAFWMSFPLKY